MRACSLARSSVRRPSRRASVAVRAEQPQQHALAVSRREAGLAALAAVAAFANVAPARAGLFGGGQKAEEEYQAKTVSNAANWPLSWTWTLWHSIDAWHHQSGMEALMLPGLPAADTRPLPVCRPASSRTSMPLSHWSVTLPTGRTSSRRCATSPTCGWPSTGGAALWDCDSRAASDFI